MTNDKRTVATDALATLGTIIDNKQKRDAIHLAVEPVIAGEDLSPGFNITVKNGIATATMRDTALGIVDPFLTEFVKKGQYFWFIMYPRMVHSLRHVWTHPAFPDEIGTPAELTKKQIAEAWLRKYAEELDIGFRSLVEGGHNWIECEDYLIQGGTLEGQYTSDEFWKYFQDYTGITVDENKQQNFFGCSC